MLKVRYYAHHLELSGYGRAAAGYLAGLERTGEVELDVLPVEGLPIDSLHPVDVAIYHTTPHRLASVTRGQAGKHVALTTWETHQMPTEHLKTLEAFDATIVPSNFCKELIAEDNQKAFVVPHGFDPQFWQVSDQPHPSSIDGIFTFYSIGAWGERKNTLGLIRAYLHAFEKTDRVRLVLVLDKGNFVSIQSLIHRAGVPIAKLPGLVISDQRFSDEEILKLHQDGDCFVTATRGEGFGLPIFEAALMGKPIISPTFGGQADFLQHAANQRSVWHALTPVFPAEDDLTISQNGVATLKTTLARGSSCKQLWAEPSLDRLSFLMRFTVAEWRDGRLSDNHSCRSWFDENYSFDAIGRRLLNTLKEIL